MILHITEKLRKKLHIPPLPVVSDIVGPHLRWYANLFYAERTQYVLTTNAASLFTVIMYGRGKTYDYAYLSSLRGDLESHLMELDLRPVWERCLNPGWGRVTWSKTVDRSVLGSMNDMVSLCKYRLAEADVAPAILSRDLNETPFSALRYGNPRKAFTELPME